MNSVAISVSFGGHVQVFLIYPVVELLGGRIYICLALVDNVKQFSKVIVPMYTSTIRV